MIPTLKKKGVRVFIWNESVMCLGVIGSTVIPVRSIVFNPKGVMSSVRHVV